MSNNYPLNDSKNPTVNVPEIGLTIVASRRPDLLGRTLESFYFNLLSFVQLREVRVNVDPIFGDKEDHLRCLELLRVFFPGAKVNQPGEASFGSAVKWLWSGISGGPFLHLEDDWMLRGPINVRQALSCLSDRTRSVCMLTSKKYAIKASRKTFSEGIKKNKIFGVTVSRTTLPRFNLSPSFFDGDFAQNCAALMDPNLDPEKQMRRPHNPRLTNYIEQYRCRFLKTEDGGPLVDDIGLNWRHKRGIKKLTGASRSSWHKS